MNANNQPLACVKGTSTLVRAKFGPGMLLQHEDLEQLNLYTRDLNRLLFRSLLGCGVVCGLVVGTKVNCGKVTVTVESGLALDCQGDPIHVPQAQTVVLDEKCNPEMPGCVWVILCGTQKCCSPRTSMCSSDDDESASVCTRERSGFQICLVRSRPRCTCSCAEPGPNDVPQGVPDDACWCVNPEHPCYKDHYLGKCGCDCEDCANCDCDCVLLARLDRLDDNPEHPVWKADHRVRRFIRPMLMRDPQVHIEDEERRERYEQQAQVEQEPAKTPAQEAVDAATGQEQSPSYTPAGPKSSRKPGKRS